LILAFAKVPALVAVHVCGIKRTAAAPPHQEFRTPREDYVTPPASWRRLARRFLRQLRQCKDIAPCLPGRHNLVAVRTHAKRDCQRRIAMQQHQHLGAVDAAQRNAAEIADTKVDGHPHALDGTPEHDTLAVKFDAAHAVVGAEIMRVKAHGKRERVEPQLTALSPRRVFPVVMREHARAASGWA
jgi:hypothetical protein